MVTQIQGHRYTNTWSQECTLDSVTFLSRDGKQHIRTCHPHARGCVLTEISEELYQVIKVCPYFSLLKSLGFLVLWGSGVWHKAMTTWTEWKSGTL